jgi:hypothetical protein
MDTKNLVIFGAGVIAGYLLVDYLRKNPMGTTTPTQNIPPPAPPVVNDKVAICQASLDEHLQTLRMIPESLEAYKQQYMSDCINDTGMFSPEANNMKDTSGEYGYNSTCPEGLILCTNQPVGGAVKCYDPNANYVMNPCA